MTVRRGKPYRWSRYKAHCGRFCAKQGSFVCSCATGLTSLIRTHDKQSVHRIRPQSISELQTHHRDTSRHLVSRYHSSRLCTSRWRGAPPPPIGSTVHSRSVIEPPCQLVVRKSVSEVQNSHRAAASPDTSHRGRPPPDVASGQRGSYTYRYGHL